MQRRELHKTYTKQFAVPPKISAKSFVVIEKNAGRGTETKMSKLAMNSASNNHKVHLSFNSKSAVQVASLTKIMTCVVALELCERFALRPHD